MYSLLFFILCLFNIIIYFFYQNYEFVAFLVGLIYFGAILILFFYIILLLNLQQVIRDNKHIKKIPFILFIGILCFITSFSKLKSLGLFLTYPIIIVKQQLLVSMETLSLVLFNNFGLHIIIVGLILFITLIGLVLMLVQNKNININYFRKST